MSKIKCIVNLKENEKTVFDNKVFYGVKIGNKITYSEDKIMVTILEFDNKIIMKRVENDYQISLEFEEGKNTINKYFVNNDNLWLPLDTFTDKILVDDSSIRVQYELKLDNKPTKFLFEIQYEVIE